MLVEVGSQEFAISSLKKAYGHSVYQEPTEQEPEATLVMCPSLRFSR